MFTAAVEGGQQFLCGKPTVGTVAVTAISWRWCVPDEDTYMQCHRIALGYCSRVKQQRAGSRRGVGLVGFAMCGACSAAMQQGGFLGICYPRSVLDGLIPLMGCTSSGVVCHVHTTMLVKPASTCIIY